MFLLIPIINAKVTAGLKFVLISSRINYWIVLDEIWYDHSFRLVSSDVDVGLFLFIQQFLVVEVWRIVIEGIHRQKLIANDSWCR